ncbi:ATP-binding protein [Actinomadura fulvescens]|uniref:Histidine kinase/HSP90-like ATPase domain-containing protein n=1 Tax=Actinomadura fulvescens TaxID=46160 RepID=A0ABN3PV96_9ACTN
MTGEHRTIERPSDPAEPHAEAHAAPTAPHAAHLPAVTSAATSAVASAVAARALPSTTVTADAPPAVLAVAEPRDTLRPPDVLGSPDVLLGELNLPAAHASVPLARGFSRSITTACQIPDVRDDAEVLVSELVTNAVQHAAVSGATLCLRMLRAGTRLRIEVHDPSPVLPRAVRINLLEETGRGWFLVAIIAERHGIEQTSAGKSVWCEVPAWP